MKLLSPILILSSLLAPLITEAANLPDELLEEAEMFAIGQVILYDWQDNEDYYSSYFKDNALYESYTSVLSVFYTEKFYNNWVETTLLNLESSMYKSLPASKTSALASSITSYYSLFTSLESTVTTVTPDVSTIATESSYDIAVPQASSSGAFSIVYGYAECDALYSDIANHASIYNSFYNTYTNTAVLSSFFDAYTGYTGATNESAFDMYCTEMNNYLSYFPWQSRILASAKTLWTEYTSEYIYYSTSYYSTTPSTTYTDTTVTVTDAYESTLYEQAKLYAVIADYQDNVYEYTSFLSSYLSAKPSATAMSKFADDLVLMNASTTMSSEAYYSIYSDISKIMSEFSWSSRLDYVAKTVYESFTSVYPESTGSSSPSPSITASTAQATGYTKSVIYPIVISTESVSYWTSDNVASNSTITVTKTTSIVSTSIMTSSATGDITSKFQSTISISSDIESIMVCGVNALIYDYKDYNSEYTSFISESSDNSKVKDYTEALSIYSSSNILANTNELATVLETFYNFIAVLPETMTDRIYDLLGYNYIATITDSNYRMSNYVTGDGYIFNELFRATTESEVSTSVASGNGSSSSTSSDINEAIFVIPTAVDIQLSATSSPPPGYTVITYLKTGEHYQLFQTSD
ncbi:hypothetical protein CANARDRAFT_112672 [[Candida] arabinofermentans NRRL YB-2248]|uniref:Uncharacterized protein n=1 Tax=[Candida] arabinofermentans NRRL YB-2248 TaxID=983967 RepID=A0A1E4T4B8_9ASCO|nr:hypothetical protein CANARDRAFT_112672 [[Candida] arabinofermentans NRRL YB-2248]